MKVSILTIGDELLIGQVVNTNAQWISKKISQAGGEVVLHLSTADNFQAISKNLTRCLEDSDVVLVSGGLGPTHDDLTVEAIAKYFELELEFRAEALEQAKTYFAARGREMPKNNEKQAMIPKGASLLMNDCGTASGVWLENLPKAPGKKIALLPGVPYELESMISREVLPRIPFAGERVYQKTWVFVGVGESLLAEMLKGYESFLSEKIKVAFLPSPQSVRMRLTLLNNDTLKAEAQVKDFEKFILDRAGRFYIGGESESLEEIVGKMLREKNQTLTLAESCTGGRVSDRMTNIAGSSEYILGGIVAYSNDVKIEALGVRAETIQKFGAVSSECAIEMAIKVREKLGSDIGLSITGIAGPGGGTPEKPVGLVYIALADARNVHSFKNVFDNDRERNKQRSSQTALNLLRRYLIGDLEGYEKT